MKKFYLSRFFKTQKQQRSAVVASGLCLIALVSFLVWHFAFAVNNNYWRGTVSSSWNTGGNWSLGTVPGSNDIAIFDNYCVTNSTNCNVTIDTNITNISGINFTATYTGTTTQSGSYTMNVGASGWVQAGGTFAGGSGAITTQTFSQTGGTFTSTSGTLKTGNGVTVSSTIFNYTGGTFNAGTGTLLFSSTVLATCYGGTPYIVNTTAQLTLNNVEMAIASGACGASYPNYFQQTGLSIIVQGNFTETSGVFQSGTMDIYGASLTAQAAASGLNGIIRLVGSTNQTLSGSGAFPNVVVNKPSGSVLAGTASLNMTSLTLTSGLFNAPATLNLGYTLPGGGANGEDSAFSNSITILSGNPANFIHNNGVINVYRGMVGGSNYTVSTIDGAFSLWNIQFTALPSGYGVAGILNFVNNPSIQNDFTITKGAVAGAVALYHNFVVGVNASGGTGSITFTGSANQTYTKMTGGVAPTGTTIIDKPAGYSVSLVASSTVAFGPLTFPSTNESTFSQGAVTLTCTTFTLSGGGYVQGSAPLTCATFTMPSGSTGIYTQSPIYTTGTLTVNGAFTEAAGIFNGGRADMTIQTFAQSGGVFTSTGGILTLGLASAVSFTVLSKTGGTFNPNSGTVSFSFSDNNDGAGTYAFVNVSAPLTLYNLTVNSGYGNQSRDSLSITGSDIIVTGTFTHQGGRTSGGNIEVRQNVVIQSGALYGTTTLTFTGTNNQTYAYASGGVSLPFVINKSSGVVSPAVGTTDLSLALFTLTQGTFVAPSGITTIGVQAPYNPPVTIFTYSAGMFDAITNHGTVKFTNYGFDGYNVSTANISIAPTLTLALYAVEINMGNTQTGVAATLQQTNTGSIVVQNTFTDTNGILGSGTWTLQGNAVIGSSADGGTAKLNLTGTNNQTFTNQGGTNPTGNITINKTGGSVTLGSNALWNATGQTLTITNGVFDQGALYALTTSATTTIAQGGIWRNNGTGAVTLGGNVVNNGQVQFAGSGTCGGADTIVIASTNTTQRTWTGTGSALMSNVSASYQAGTQNVYISDSTRGTGLGTNWISRNDCSAFDVGISSGVVNWLGGTINIP